MSQREKGGKALSFAKREYIKFLIKLMYREATDQPLNREGLAERYEPLPYDKLAFSSVRWALKHHKEVEFTKDDIKVVFGVYDYQTPPTLNKLDDEVLLHIYSKLNKIEDRLK